ncbi:ImmA/IrrE family metallo-endopeptidase [Kribbella sp. NPDC050470]|uniref:ImmA/IrrE family metallo-endopeptidase n=1 Tax=unclassified Kribbella TaxID=2644121 RepID=UPI00378ECBF7
MTAGDNFAGWLRQGDFRSIAQALVELERQRGVLDLAAFRDDPIAALSRLPELSVELDDRPPAGCSVSGFYRPDPPTIVVHPSVSNRRDNFTVLHEYGHHTQRQHLDWLSVWMNLGDNDGRRVNEIVSDTFASEILLPADSLTLGTGRLSATHIRDAYENSQASRQATVMRAAQLAAPDERVVIVITTPDGTVTFARSPSSDVMPRRGAIQPDLARLMTEALASNGYARGRLVDGVQTTSGWTQHGLIAEVAVDQLGRYGFVVITRESRFGPEQWDRAEFDCPNAACAETFVLDESVQRCPDCKDPRCSSCGACSCDEETVQACPRCFLQLSVAETSGAVAHECY